VQLLQLLLQLLLLLLLLLVERLERGTVVGGGRPGSGRGRGRGVGHGGRRRCGNGCSVHEHFTFCCYFCFLAYVEGFSFLFSFFDSWIVEFSGNLTATLAYYL